MNTCEDCGTKLRNGICTNCHEELYINDYQLPEVIDTNPHLTVSKAWKEQVERQRKRQAQIDKMRGVNYER